MRTALVTGANRGIGLALTKELLHRGYTVHATHRRDIGGLATIIMSTSSPMRWM